MSRREARARPDALERFVALSAALTGYAPVDLHSTGMVETYWRTLEEVVGGRVTGELLSAWDGVVDESAGDPERIAGALAGRVLDDPTLGPVARNLVVLWYLGQWNQMPAEWRARHGAAAGDRSRVVSAEAYREGLVWRAIGAHPMGAHQQGFGAWALPPSRATDV